MADYPAAAFVRFYRNHRLLEVDMRPTWRTVDGGSRAYVERLRVEEAGQRLIASNLGVERIARSVGYLSADVFRRAFERHYGIAPLQYRAQFQSRSTR
jgi:transcriptional regulator GlxA family with amidase domain